LRVIIEEDKTVTDFTERQLKDIAYYKEHLSEFLENELMRYKHVIIADEKIQGVFDTIEAAIDYAINNYSAGEYIIQQIIDEKEIINYIRAAVV
jgi:hypothetical protein